MSDIDTIRAALHFEDDELALTALDAVEQRIQQLEHALERAWHGRLYRTEYLQAMNKPDPLDTL